jgi:tetratricopeptide (TPR) repeat protein
MRITVAFLILAALAASGCKRTSTAAKANRASNSSAQWSEDLFSFAIANLNHLEDNDCREMMQSMQMRRAALLQPELAPGSVSINALLASWPEPDMLRQVVSRLNQWVDTLEKPGPWKPDPMLAALPPDVAKLPMVAELDQAHFSAYDGYALMEAVWARDVSRWAKGNTSDDLLAARNLFDWTVRNIQLDEDRSDHVPQVPWETLFLGHGTAMERAWTYILLLRQCDIEAAVLALPANESTAAASSAGQLKPCCVAVLIGDKEKKLYLFDPRLGLPLPAANGITAGKSGQLEVQPATLEQVIRNPQLLDRLALAADRPYWARKADLKHAVALVEASPLYLEPRAKRIESSLAGERKMVLNAEPSRQAKSFQAAGVGDVRLWDLPYTTLQRRMAVKPEDALGLLSHYFRFIGFGAGSLYKGRILHLKGRFYDEKGAIAYYQKARPRVRTVLADENKRGEAAYKSLKEHLQKAGKEITPSVDEQCKRWVANEIRMELEAIRLGKIDAAYWLGLIQYEQGEYDSAFDYFVARTLQAGSSVFWEAGARYNMARCQEMDGRWREAVQKYESNMGLPNHDGSLLRARWLAGVHGVKPAAEAKKTEPGKKEGGTPEKKKTDHPG